jgi:hypothetical protein
MAPSSSFGTDPGLYLGARVSPRRAFSTYRLTEERFTEKVRAAFWPWASRLPPRRLSFVLGLRSRRS